MKIRISLAILTFLFLIAMSCGTDKFETTPTIRIKSMNTDFVPLNGTLVIILECTDKEGDVQDSVIIIKQRLNRRATATIRDTLRYKIPAFPQNNSIQITANITYQDILSAITPLTIPGSSPPQKENDTLILRLAVRDTAGNVSDTLSSKQIVVQRQ